MSNIFTSENITKYSKNASDLNSGNWTTRNGIPAISISPNMLYYGEDTEENKNKTNGILHNEFDANKNYLFDMWIDADDIYYSEESRNVSGGIDICYTDGTRDHFIVTGNKDTPKGFQHIAKITTKPIYGINIYYHISTPAYYRWDSTITELNDLNIYKTGIIESSFNENSDDVLFKNGMTTAQEFLEI